MSAAIEKKNARTPAQRVKGRLAITTAFATVAMFGYSGRGAYAGSCVGGAGSYVCSGPADPATDTTQSFVSGSGPLAVTTDPGFGIDTRGTGGDAISLQGNGSATSLSFIESHGSAISAEGVGVSAYSTGAAASSVNVHTTGTVTSEGANGVYGAVFGSDAKLTISTADVVAKQTAIYGLNTGSGDLTITSTGSLSGLMGVNAQNHGATGASTIAVADVIATGNGVYLNHNSSGAASITTTGTVMTTDGSGIAMRAGANSGDVTMEVGAITGDRNGVYLRHNGSGAVGITTNGVVSADSGAGIYAVGSGTDLKISANADVSGNGHYAIGVRNSGTGVTEVTATGAVTGTGSFSDYGVYVDARGGTDVKVAVDGLVTGHSRVISQNSGVLDATFTSGVVSDANGILLLAGGTDLKLTTGAVSARSAGVSVSSSGSGSTDVTVTGAVKVEDQVGVFVSNTGTDLKLVVSDVSTYAGDPAVIARNFGTGNSYLGVNGVITTTDGTGRGIQAIRYSNDPGQFDVVLNDGASVNMAGGIAILNNSSDANVMVKSGASVTGRIALEGGNDTLTFDGGDFSGVTAFDGGDGTGDALVLRNSDGTLDGSLVSGFETVEVGTGSAISVQNGLTATSFSVGDGGLIGGSGSIDAAVEILAGGGVGPGNSPGILTINGDIDFTGGSFIDIELGGTTAGTEYDQLDVFGIATLGSGTIFNIDGFGGFGPTDGDIFDILVADTISLTALTDLTFNFNIGGNFNVGIFDVGGRDALRLTSTSISTVPIPASMLLYGSGFLLLGGIGWMKRRRKSEQA